jgi:hypothetical protein
MIPDIERVGDTLQISLRQTDGRARERKIMGMGNVPRCQHIKMNGTQCGSPALRWRRQCFFHERIRRERAKIAKDMSAQRRFDLPLLEDANSVQVALMKTIQMLGSGRMDHRTAGLMLYALQTASINLRNADFEADDVTEVVINRDDVHRTDLGGPQWHEEDFEEPEEEKAQEVQEADETVNEIEDEAEEQEPVAAAQMAAVTVKKTPAPVERLSLEETRMKVQGAVRSWLSETLGEKAAANPD